MDEQTSKCRLYFSGNEMQRIFWVNNNIYLFRSNINALNVGMNLLVLLGAGPPATKHVTASSPLFGLPFCLPVCVLLHSVMCGARAF